LIPVTVDNTYRLFDDGRQKCLQTPKGKAEYAHRREAMAMRQMWICACGCGRPMMRTMGFASSITFQHDKLRGKDIDERIVDADGGWLNCAMRWDCNGAMGSRRRLTA